MKPGQNLDVTVECTIFNLLNPPPEQASLWCATAWHGCWGAQKDPPKVTNFELSSRKIGDSTSKNGWCLVEKHRETLKIFVKISLFRGWGNLPPGMASPRSCAPSARLWTMSRPGMFTMGLVNVQWFWTSLSAVFVGDDIPKSWAMFN